MGHPATPPDTAQPTLTSTTDHPTANRFKGLKAEDALEPEILLTRAAAAGNTSEVKRLLAAGADPDGLNGTKARAYRQSNGPLGIREASTPLLAALAGAWHEEWRYGSAHPPGVAAQVVDLLLKAGADPNFQDSGGSFALESAVNIDELAIVKRLIDAGANAKMSSAGYPVIGPSAYDPESLMDYAVGRGNVEIVRLLLEAGADPYEVGYSNRNALTRAAYRQSPEVLRLLLEQMDPDAMALNRALAELIKAWPDDYDASPKELPRARANWFDCFIMLVEHGATLQGMSRYYADSYLEDIVLPTVRSWLNHAGQQGVHRQPPLGPAPEDFIYSDNLDTIRLALERGHLSANQRLSNGHRAFASEPEHAVFQQLFDTETSEQLIKLFVEYGIDVNARDSFGRTLLHYAADDSPELIPLLIDKGADVNAIDVGGSTPLDELFFDEPDDPYAALLKAHGARHGDEGFPRYPEIVNVLRQLHNDPLVEKLMGPERQDAFKRILARRRYLASVDTSVIYRRHDFTIDRVVQRELPDQPDVFILFDQDKDAQGRSRFIMMRGDGAMLPRLPGEQWRLRESDIVDLDADGSDELLIDVTLTDGKSTIGALRIVSLTKPHAKQWTVVYPHRDHPGGFDWRLGNKNWSTKTHKIAFGPANGTDELLWETWTMTYDEDWLSEQTDKDEYISQIKHYPLVLDDDGKTADAARRLAERLNPQLYQ